VSSNWYEAVIEKFGTAENFVDQLYEKQGLTEEDSVSLVQERQKCLTVDELIKSLKDIRKSVGGDAKVLMLDSSGYDYDVTRLTIDHNTVVIS
jgi:hypothetical protein